MSHVSISLLATALFVVTSVQSAQAQGVQLSAETEECLTCHTDTHPGLVASWQKSRHSTITPAQALKKTELERRISSSALNSSRPSVAVGCYECHGLNTEKHAVAFEHNGHTINVIVSPYDCATCHPVEADQYADNLMSHAHTNLVENGLYQTLISSV